MIPVSEPYLKGNEINYVLDCFKENWISSNGKYIKKFEDEFANYCGAKFGVTTTNGTSALHLALASLKIGKNDEVILPDFTIVSCLNAVLYVGAKPIFVDIDPKTHCIDVEKIENVITNKTKVIMPVHIFGHPCDMDPILDIAEKNNLFVVEDAAEAHGAEYKKRKVGAIGDIGCFSFYSNKIITTGEGGMIITNNKNISDRAKYLTNLAFDKDRTYKHEELAFNYRMTNIQAAIGLAQLENIEKHIKLKRKMGETYTKLLKKIQGITTPIEKKWAKNVFWMYKILVEDNFPVSREMLREELFKMGIETRLVFYPLHLQSYVKYSKKASFPNSEYVSKRGMYLPSGIGIKKSEIKIVVDAIKEISEK